MLTEFGSVFVCKFFSKYVYGYRTFLTKLQIQFCAPVAFNMESNKILILVTNLIEIVI